MNKVGQNCEQYGGFLHAGEFLGGLSIKFVGSMLTMNWAVSLQHLLFEGSLKSCHGLCFNLLLFLPNYLYDL